MLFVTFVYPCFICLTCWQSLIILSWSYLLQPTQKSPYHPGSSLSPLPSPASVGSTTSSCSGAGPTSIPSSGATQDQVLGSMYMYLLIEWCGTWCLINNLGGPTCDWGLARFCTMLIALTRPLKWRGKYASGSLIVHNWTSGVCEWENRQFLVNVNPLSLCSVTRLSPLIIFVCMHLTYCTCTWLWFFELWIFTSYCLFAWGIIFLM